MNIKNSDTQYGWLSITFHWLTAVTVICLYAVGLWMDNLDYTHPLYKTAPHLHKSFGVMLIILVLCRLAWRIYSPPPKPMPTHKTYEKVAAKIVHWLFYVLILLMFPAGYLITTAQGQSLEVFNWVDIPATITGIDNLEDIAGEFHELMAHLIILLVIFHAAGAVKHHFIDKDTTLMRMFGRK